MSGGRGRTVVAIVSGMVVAWVLSVVTLMVGVDLLLGDPPAIFVGLPEKELRPAPFWDRVRWHPMSNLALTSLSPFAGSLFGGVLVCRLLHRDGSALVLMPALGALLAPALLVPGLLVVDVEIAMGTLATAFGAALLGAWLARRVAARRLAGRSM